PGRYLHTATRLDDGTVLLAGGMTPPSQYPIGAVLFHADDDSLSSGSPLTGQRRSHRASRLPSGDVLVTGGYHTGPLDSAALFDASTKTFAVAGATLLQVRYGHSSTTLA